MKFKNDRGGHPREQQASRSSMRPKLWQFSRGDAVSPVRLLEIDLPPPPPLTVPHTAVLGLGLGGGTGKRKTT